MHDRPTPRRARYERARIESAQDQAWQTALLVEIAIDKRNAAIRNARHLGLSLRTLARLTRLSHETIRRLTTDTAPAKRLARSRGTVSQRFPTVVIHPQRVTSSMRGFLNLMRRHPQGVPSDNNEGAQ